MMATFRIKNEKTNIFKMQLKPSVVHISLSTTYIQLRVGMCQRIRKLRVSYKVVRTMCFISLCDVLRIAAHCLQIQFHFAT